ncbi:MAG TPA: hypothetical protein VIW24_16815 [Aldersonia sp.]
MLGALIDDSPYRHNAFRLGGLRVDATPRDLRKRQAELEAGEKLGVPLAGVAGVLPVRPAPELADVRTALNHLRDPVNRLMQELFWFWPVDGDDPAMELLAGGDVSGASDLWLRQLNRSGPTGGIAAHNLAILRQLHGLETQLGRCVEPWLEGLSAWNTAIDSEACWDRLLSRARHIDDRRLGPETIAELRRAMPDALLGMHASLIVRGAERGDTAAVDVHIEVLDRFAREVTRYRGAFTAATIDDARRSAARELAARLTAITDDEVETAVDQPRQGSTAANRMLDRANLSLCALDRLRAPGDPVRDGAHDRLVQAAVVCDARHYNETGDLAASETLFARVGPIAATEASRKALNDARVTVAEARIGWLCDNAMRDVDADERTGAEAARQLLDRAQAPLGVLREVRGPSDERLRKQLDRVAARAASCVVAYFNQTGDLEVAEQLLARVKPLALMQETKDVLHENIATLAAIRRRREKAARLIGTCWFCKAGDAADGKQHNVALHTDVARRGNTKHWQSLTANVPRCVDCWAEHNRKKAPLTTYTWVHVACWIGGFASLIAANNIPAIWTVFIVCLLLGMLTLLEVMRLKNAAWLDPAMEFPPVQQLLNEGWRIGVRP